MAVFTTEITSDRIASDNPIHQRLLRPYEIIAAEQYGDVLEVGCGEGRGVHYILPKSRSFTAIDKIPEVINQLSEKFPSGKFRQMNIPPFHGIADNFYDMVVSFQVIEHIKDDHGYLSEIHRVLKPGGVAYITTPNIKLSLTRNPWHIREYTAKELGDLASKFFNKVELKGIAGNEKVMEYHERNRKSVRKFTRFDILDLQHKMPASLLRIPYDLMNRLNRNRLKSSNDELVMSIKSTDYYLSDEADTALDLFLKVTK